MHDAFKLRKYSSGASVQHLVPMEMTLVRVDVPPALVLVRSCSLAVGLYTFWLSFPDQTWWSAPDSGPGRFFQADEERFSATEYWTIFNEGQEEEKKLETYSLSLARRQERFQCLVLTHMPRVRRGETISTLMGW